MPRPIEVWTKSQTKMNLGLDMTLMSNSVQKLSKTMSAKYESIFQST